MIIYLLKKWLSVILMIAAAVVFIMLFLNGWKDFGIVSDKAKVSGVEPEEVKGGSENIILYATNRRLLQGEKVHINELVEVFHGEQGHETEGLCKGEVLYIYDEDGNKWENGKILNETGVFRLTAAVEDEVGRKLAVRPFIILVDGRVK